VGTLKWECSFGFESWCVPDFPFKQQELQRFASAPLAKAPPRPPKAPPRPAKRIKIEKSTKSMAVLNLHAAEQFSFEICVFRGLCDAYSLGNLHAVVQQLGLFGV
jgi:hypothetical protein